MEMKTEMERKREGGQSCGGHILQRHMYYFTTALGKEAALGLCWTHKLWRTLLKNGHLMFKEELTFFFFKPSPTSHTLLCLPHKTCANNMKYIGVHQHILILSAVQSHPCSKGIHHGRDTQGPSLLWHWPRPEKLGMKMVGKIGGTWLGSDRKNYVFRFRKWLCKECVCPSTVLAIFTFCTVVTSLDQVRPKLTLTALRCTYVTNVCVFPCCQKESQFQTSWERAVYTRDAGLSTQHQRWIHILNISNVKRKFNKVLCGKWYLGTGNNRRLCF